MNASKRRGPKFRFDDETCSRIRTEHESGESIRKLGVKYGAEFETIKRCIKRAGGVVRVRPLNATPKGVQFAGVSVLAKSGNSKLGDCAATYAAAQSCPTSCPFYEGGCYAEYDQTALAWNRITSQAEGLTAVQIATSESTAIRLTPAVRDMRLHVAGDSTTREGTRTLADACEDYVARGLAVGKRLVVWGYTHAWRTVLRADWWRVSILASCETPADVRAAWRRGYAAAIAVTKFHSRQAFELWDGEGVIKAVPCPAQTGERTCTECRLCFDDRRLLSDRVVIAFETHGTGKKRADETLRRVSLPMVGRIKQERRAA